MKFNPRRARRWFFDSFINLLEAIVPCVRLCVCVPARASLSFFLGSPWPMAKQTHDDVKDQREISQLECDLLFIYFSFFFLFIPSNSHFTFHKHTIFVRSFRVGVSFFVHRRCVIIYCVHFWFDIIIIIRRRRRQCRRRPVYVAIVFVSIESLCIY